MDTEARPSDLPLKRTATSPIATRKGRTVAEERRDSRAAVRAATRHAVPGTGRAAHEDDGAQGAEGGGVSGGVAADARGPGGQPGGDEARAEPAHRGQAQEKPEDAGEIPASFLVTASAQERDLGGAGGAPGGSPPADHDRAGDDER